MSYIEQIFEIITSTGIAQAEAENQLIKTAKPGRNGTVRVTFALPRETPGGAVSVVGDFNGWDPFAHPLRRRGTRTPSATVAGPARATPPLPHLARGGVWCDDDAAPHKDAHGGYVTV